MCEQQPWPLFRSLPSTLFASLSSPQRPKARLLSWIRGLHWCWVILGRYGSSLFGRMHRSGRRRCLPTYSLSSRLAGTRQRRKDKSIFWVSDAWCQGSNRCLAAKSWACGAEICDWPWDRFAGPTTAAVATIHKLPLILDGHILIPQPSNMPANTIRCKTSKGIFHTYRLLETLESR